MRRTKKNVIYHELIGLQVKVKDHVDPGLKGLEGKVVDETMHALKIKGGNGKVRTVPKHGGVFLFKLGKNHFVEISGDTIMGRPEDRLKRYRGGK